MELTEADEKRLDEIRERDEARQLQGYVDTDDSFMLGIIRALKQENERLKAGKMDLRGRTSDPRASAAMCRVIPEKG